MLWVADPGEGLLEGSVVGLEVVVPSGEVFQVFVDLDEFGELFGESLVFIVDPEELLLGLFQCPL